MQKKTTQRSARAQLLRNIRRARATPVHVDQDLTSYLRHMSARDEGPLHKHGKKIMDTPTHLLAVELIPSQDTDQDHPPLPGMPSPLHRLRVHQFHLTMAMGYSLRTGPWVEAVEGMDYLHPTWLTLEPQAKDLDTVCMQVHLEVAATYNYVNSKSYRLQWYTQEHLQTEENTLEGQTWDRALAWAWAITESSLDTKDPRMEAARAMLRVHNFTHTHGQDRSQLWVGLGTARGKRATPGTLAMARSGKGFKPIRTPYA